MTLPFIILKNKKEYEKDSFIFSHSGIGMV